MAKRNEQPLKITFANKPDPEKIIRAFMKCWVADQSKKLYGDPYAVTIKSITITRREEAETPTC